jgi:hypothetical protein
MCPSIQLSQFENLLTGAYGPLILLATYKKLTATHISVIDAEKVTKVLPLPRKLKAVSEFSEVSREMLRRVILEFQRRYCDNTTEIVQEGLDLVIGDRELVVTYLDLRTLGASHLTSEQRGRAKMLLRAAYVTFAKKIHETKRGAVAAPGAPAAAAAASASTAWIHGQPLNVGAGIVITDAHSSDESGADDGDNGLSAIPDFIAEFERSYAAWKALGKTLDWCAIPEIVGVLPAKESLDVIDDLLPLNIAPLYKKLIVDGKYGLIPLMAVASTYTIGGLNAESYVERVISAANLIMDEGNSLLGDVELEMMVVLRIDRKFMEFMRAKYGHVHHETFKCTVLRDVDNETDSEDDEEG